MDASTKRKLAAGLAAAGAIGLSGFYNLASLHQYAPLAIAAGLAWVAYAIWNSEI